LKKLRLKKKADKSMSLRQRRIIRTKEKLLLKKELLSKSKRKKVKKRIVKIASTKKTVGCGGCRRKRRKSI